MLLKVCAGGDSHGPALVPGVLQGGVPEGRRLRAGALRFGGDQDLRVAAAGVTTEARGGDSIQFQNGAIRHPCGVGAVRRVDCAIVPAARKVFVFTAGRASATVAA